MLTIQDKNAQFRALVARLIVTHGHDGAAKELIRRGLMTKPRITGSTPCPGIPGHPCGKKISANKERCFACERKYQIDVEDAKLFAHVEEKIAA